MSTIKGFNITNDPTKEYGELEVGDYFINGETPPVMYIKIPRMKGNINSVSLKDGTLWSFEDKDTIIKVKKIAMSYEV